MWTALAIISWCLAGFIVAYAVMIRILTSGRTPDITDRVFALIVSFVTCSFSIIVVVLTLVLWPLVKIIERFTTNRPSPTSKPNGIFGGGKKKEKDDRKAKKLKSQLKEKEKEIKRLNARISELNKCSRTDLMDV